MARHSPRTSPNGKDWHKADIKAALEKRGWSLRGLAAHYNLSHCAVRDALRRPYPASEKRIADELGLHPMVIWPSRYDEHGHSNRRRGNPNWISRRPAGGNRSTRTPGGHGNSAGKN